MPDQKVAEILQFIMSYTDIQVRGPNIPQLLKRELCQVMDYIFPSNNTDVRQRPGKGFKAVMRSLLRCLGCGDNVVSAFSANQRFYKYVGWNEEGRAKVNEAAAYRTGTLPPASGMEEHEDEDDDGKKSTLGIQISTSAAKAGGGGVTIVSSLKSSRPVGRVGRGQFVPKYDVLFSRTSWSYYLRVFMPMCEPTNIQSGIKLDLLRGQLSLKGRYVATASLPPWCTQNEPVNDLEIVQSLPASALGDFHVDIPLPFDVDRTGRKEVHVTDIGVIVCLKRLKDEAPQMDFKVHTFAQPTPGLGAPPPSSSRGASANAASAMLLQGIPLQYS